MMVQLNAYDLYTCMYTKIENCVKILYDLGISWKIVHAKILPKVILGI